MVNFFSFYSLVVAASLVVLSPSAISNVKADSTDGFSIELIHRFDNPKSPSYNPSLSPYQRVQNALQRTMNRLNFFKGRSLTEVYPSHEDYLMNISFGTPPVYYLGIADTGSDLVWVQCEPCVNCYKQKYPLFNPKRSSTYREIACTADQCGFIRGLCSPTNNSCLYSQRYMDRSGTNGTLAYETVTLTSTSGQLISLPNTVIGCGHDNKVIFTEYAAGMIGLGQGLISLISRMHESIQGKFSYCLAPLSSQSTSTFTMNFGQKSVVSGKDVVSVPLYMEEGSVDQYCVTLLGFSVGNQRLDMPSFSYDYDYDYIEGNTIFDTGSVLSYISPAVLDKLAGAVKSVTKMELVDDPLKILSVCYRTRNETGLPSITIHFQGADLRLNPENVFYRTSEDVTCLAFDRYPGVTIIGNLVQMNFLVGYDLKKGTVSFKPTDCTKEA